MNQSFYFQTWQNMVMLERNIKIGSSGFFFHWEALIHEIWVLRGILRYQ